MLFIAYIDWYLQAKSYVKSFKKVTFIRTSRFSQETLNLESLLPISDIDKILPILSKFLQN